VDAWVWGNTGWERSGIEKPPEFASAAGFAEYVSGRNPEAVFVLLTHDHPDHMGDYFELLPALVAAGVNVKTVGQSDLMRRGLVEQFKKVNLDPNKVVPNAGNSINFGGTAKHGAMTVRMVPAVHSTLAGYPAAGFILDIGGVRSYLSGDTDLFGDIKLIGERYQPNVAIACAGDGPFTMGPAESALACQWLGVSQAIPVHYAHNANVLGIEAGEEFRKAMARVASSVQVTVLKPGETAVIQA
jgi:L-ascorbate metabolism protein UlaG (beta-lactamase superfamily)